MNKYKLSAIVGVSCHTTVIAETERDARNIAAGRYVSPNGEEGSEWSIEDGDGTPAISSCTVAEKDVAEEADYE